MGKLNAKPTAIPFGWNSYGMDYFDASNMLGVWKGGGRHNWNNAQYDNLLKQAGPETDQTKRNGLYADAQKLLTTDASSLFVYYQLHGYYYQPFFKGDALDKDKYGYDGIESGWQRNEQLQRPDANGLHCQQRRPVPSRFIGTHPPDPFLVNGKGEMGWRFRSRGDAQHLPYSESYSPLPTQREGGQGG